MKLSKKKVQEMDGEQLIKQHQIELSYWRHTESKIRKENIRIVEEELKRRLKIYESIP